MAVQVFLTDGHLRTLTRVELRQVNFGLSRKLTHRIVYTIRPDMVLVFRVLHLAQRELSVEDL